MKSIEPAIQAYQSVLRRAGALPHDATSARMVRETKGGTGRQGYHADIEADRMELNSKRLFVHLDSDGLPDEWETAHRLNPADATDAAKIAASGYSNLEVYCHDRAPQLINAVGN